MKPLVFIHVPHVAGWSICASLSRYEYINVHHISFIEWERILQEEFKKCFKFAFVRNPYDIAVTIYCRAINRIKNIKERFSFEEWVEETFGKDAVPGFKLQVQQFPYISTIDNKIELDFLGRYETLQDDFNKVCQLVGIKQRILPHKNKARLKTKPYSEYYVPRTKYLVGQFFKEDLEKFGYSF